VFVAGSGRSGTSLMSGILRQLGTHVPQPEVAVDATNPKGFGEPQWVVDFHNRLLRRALVQVADAHPGAWFETGRICAGERFRSEVTDWLTTHFDVADELVIKDPRLSWFLGLWRVAAVRCGATPGFVTMLRPPTEVVGSKTAAYGGRLGQVHLVAAWVNMMLHTERATRGSARSFVGYHDLLDDWTSSVHRVGEELQLGTVLHATPARLQEVHRFVDPSLHRSRLTWEDVDVPPALREIADRTWRGLSALVEAGDDESGVLQELDQARADYIELYDQAEALTRSTAVHEAKAAVRKAGRERAGAPAARRPGQQRAAAEPPPSAHGERATPARATLRSTAGKARRRLRAELGRARRAVW
jgi:hypothetical protein